MWERLWAADADGGGDAGGDSGLAAASRLEAAPLAVQPCECQDLYNTDIKGKMRPEYSKEFSLVLGPASRSGRTRSE